jgi:type II secretory pathway pseudopilin PulG
MVKIRRIGTDRARNSQAGLTLLEVMIAGMVLMVGLLVGVLPMISYGISTMKTTDEETIAKQQARETVESIYGARDTTELGWDSINPTSVCTTSGTTTVCGVFLTGPQSLYGSGADGIVGTADDAASGIQTVTLASGQTRTLSEFTRTITIGNYTNPDGTISPALRTLEVDVTYPTGNGQTRTYTINGLISQYK